MKQVKRLYKQFKPEQYKIDLNPDKRTLTFTGQVEIIGDKTGRPSQRITLHCKNLSIDAVRLIKIKDKKSNQDLDINISRFLYHQSYDELRIHTDEVLYPGKYKIVVNYHAKITRQMSGLYPSYYKHHNSEEIILATQFESHHAREVFPCIDEPEAKAIFSLQLTADSSDVVLANSVIQSTAISSEDKDKTIYSFKPTPIMSSYLVAFVIGKLKQISGQTKDGVAVSVYTRPQQIEHAKFALDVAIKTLNFYNQYFAIDYPLEKCDLVALPDFASGAMENWGLITFREQALLVDDNNTSASMKQYVANVIAHELTHQWFGNLVTMKWWNDLWLNESFASLMSYVAVDKLFPEWHVWTQFINDEQVPALKLDSLNSTHPISTEIHHPDEIRTIFDNISYEKGASVLFMLLNYIGEDKFRDGLRIYLKQHSYGNSETDDLWQAITKASHVDISSFMDPWTRQPGYPLLTVSSLDNKDIKLTQERFYLDPTTIKNESLWSIPLFSTELPQKSLVTQQDTFKLKVGQHILINSNQMGFYRTIYKDLLAEQIIDDINQAKLSELDRLSVLSNNFEAAKAGYIASTQSLHLLASYKNETSLLVWESIAANIASIRLIMDKEDLREKMKPFIIDLALKLYRRLGWDTDESDSYFDIMLRPIILSLMLSADFPDAIDRLKQIFAQKDKKAIDPNIRSVIYSKMAQIGDHDIFDELTNMYINCDNSEEKVTLAAAITNFKQPELIDKALAFILTDNVRLQDVIYWVSYSLYNRYAKDKTWTWIQLNWQWLEHNLGDDLSFYMLPRYVAAVYSNSSFIEEFKQFFMSHMSDGFVRPLAQAVETITWQSEWKKRDLDSIMNFFN